MKYAWFFFMITVFLCAISANAEYYRYVDKQGKVHYTDEISNIPADQRPENIKTYRGTSSPAPVPSEQTEETVSQQKPLNSVQDKKYKTREEELAEFNQRYDQLKELKSQLDGEYEALTKERAQLEEERKNLKTKEDIEQFNKKIELLRKKTNTYDQKTKAYTDEQAEYNIDIQAFNEKVQEELKQRVSSYESKEEEAPEQDAFTWDNEPQDTIKIDTTASLDEQRQMLTKQKAKIEEEYQGLSKEKEMLAEEKKSLKTKEDVAEYMRKKEELNQRIDQFQKKQQAFDKEVLMFNTRQEEANDKSKETTETAAQ